MDEGEAKVRSHSDVEMRVESGPATNSKRLARLAQPIGTSLGPIEACYKRVLEERPTVQGELTLSVSLPERGRVRVKPTRDAVKDAALVRCALRAVRGAGYDDAPRPASAFVRLTFVHSAAWAVAESRSRAARGAAAPVRRNAEGLPEASFATPGGEVRFTVTGKAEADAPKVAAVREGLRKAIPGFLDCRRRAARRDRSPEGEVRITLLVTRAGHGRARARRSTVPHPRAASCVVRAVSHPRFDREAAGRSEAVVRFAPYAPEPGSDEAEGRPVSR